MSPSEKRDHEGGGMSMMRTLTLTVLLVTATTTARAEADCQSIHATQSASLVFDGSCTSPTGLCTRGEVRGALSGKTSLAITALAESAGMAGAEPASTLSYQAQMTIETRQGTLRLSDVAVYDALAGVFTEVGRVSGGTGRYAGAAGTLYFSGAFDPATASFTMAVSGTLCLAR
jgi:hypothetical protein